MDVNVFTVAFVAVDMQLSQTATDLAVVFEFVVFETGEDNCYRTAQHAYESGL